MSDQKSTTEGAKRTTENIEKNKVRKESRERK